MDRLALLIAAALALSGCIVRPLLPPEPPHHHHHHHHAQRR